MRSNPFESLKIRTILNYWADLRATEQPPERRKAAAPLRALNAQNRAGPIN